jgi:hypothetical protein
VLKVRISSLSGATLAEGTCSDSGYFPPALSGVYNAALQLKPPRTLQSYGSASESADYPVGTGRAQFGYTQARQDGGRYVLDEEVIVHVERT